jgi:hypothetical protein
VTHPSSIEEHAPSRPLVVLLGTIVLVLGCILATLVVSVERHDDGEHEPTGSATVVQPATAATCIAPRALEPLAVSHAPPPAMDQELVASPTRHRRVVTHLAESPRRTNPGPQPIDPYAAAPARKPTTVGIGANRQVLRDRGDDIVR